MSESSGGAALFWGFVAIVLCVLGLTLFIGGCQSLNRPGPTEVALIRNGGPFDNKSIRECRAPGSSYAISGLASEVRMYIAGNEQRYYKVSSDPSLGQQSGADLIKVPTKDGVNVEVDAQVLFHTGFTDKAGNIPDDCALLKSFDTQFGNRKFASKDGDSYSVWDGNNGWNAFLDTILRPVVENAFREQIGSVNCADLVSSCALVQSSAQQEVPSSFTSQDNRKNFERIQRGVQDQIEKGVKSALGDEYLVGFHVQLTKVTLPDTVQKAIDDAQASFALIAEARAKKTQAEYEAEANERLSAAYRNNPNLALIQAIKELKGNPNATIILGNPGTGFNIGK